MNIGLDYDDTYTSNKKLWRSVVALMQAEGYDFHLINVIRGNKVIDYHDEAQWSVNRNDVDKMKSLLRNVLRRLVNI